MTRRFSIARYPACLPAVEAGVSSLFSKGEKKRSNRTKTIIPSDASDGALALHGRAGFDGDGDEYACF